MPTMAERYYTFNAVALNVDGLPQKILGIEVNPDGKGASGAAQVGATIVNENWDMVAVTENFNFNNDLQPVIENYYQCGTWRGKVTDDILGSLLNDVRADTDGLGFFVAKRGNYPKFTSESESWTQWRTEYGGVNDGADNLIEKGFRYYEYHHAEGIIIDVYVVHLDAGTANSNDDYENGKDKNIIAREAQLKQLADAIIAKSKTTKRPVIIMGDTNCRYTRENLKGGFIDYINNNSEGLLTIKDGWIESVYNGEYPAYPSESMMIHTYGERMGEVVDKVFYINYNYPENYTGKKLTLRANNYRLGTEYGIGNASLDHNPIIVNFTLVDEDASTLSDTDIEEMWTDEPKLEVSISQGARLESNGTYFLKNVSANSYLKSGGKWGTQTVLGSAAMPVKFILSNGKYSLQTTLNEYDPVSGSRTGENGYINSIEVGGLDEGLTFMNRPQGESAWTVNEIIKEGKYFYQLVNDEGKALAFKGNGLVECNASNDKDDRQLWTLVTEELIREQMKDATADNPYDITPLLKGADFDNWDLRNSTATWGDGFGSYSVGGVEPSENSNANAYNFCAARIQESDKEISSNTISQTLTELPIGTYVTTGHGFYRAQHDEGVISSNWKNDAIDVKVSFGGASHSLLANNNLEISAGTYGAANTFKEGSYAFTLEHKQEQEADLTIQVVIPSYKSTYNLFGTQYRKVRNWVCIDNFKILYYGDGDVETNPYVTFENKVIVHMNTTWDKLQEIADNDAKHGHIVIESYDISTVIYRLNSGMVISDIIADALCDMIDEAYNNAIAAYQAAIMENIPEDGDITEIIINPSFERDEEGWTIRGGKVVNGNAPHATKFFEGANKSWPVNQTIYNLKNGLYELTAYVNSDGNNTVYIIGNSFHKGFVPNGTFTEKKLKFLVEDGQAKIGVMGGTGDGNKYYFPNNGCPFQVDYFRLRYICDLPTGHVKLAIEDAKEIAGIDDNGNAIEDSGFDVYAKGSEEFTILKNLLNNCNSKTYTTADAAGAVSEIYADLQAAAKKQKHRGADMTYAIKNPNFELDGNYPGWTTVGQVTGYETKVALQENMTYAYVGVDGRKLYNTWDNPSTGVVGFGLTQTVEGLPTGSYKLSAMVASGTGESITLTANGVSTTVAAGADQTVGVPVEVQCDVEKGGDLVISVAGANNAWFKADDFRLTFNGHSLELTHEENPDETINDWYTDVDLTRTFKVESWQPLIVPFNMPIPANWDVREFTGIELDETGVHLKLIFSEAGQVSNIEAGKPYMIRNNGEEAMSILKIEHADVVTAKNTLKPQKKSLKENFTGSVEFQGNYGKTTIPQGAYYISGNKFYIASKDIEMKGYRAFFNPDDFVKAKVRSLGMGSRTETFIDSIELEDEVVIGIYDVNGIRLSEMKPGINILHMNNGTTKKVIVK